ncbi:MAG: polysaccharide deacetylase family protein [Cyanothece sp. SIO1E1]|nr:polysaccharide deacetylase family protein [Cyanothece sp. SIO1E1]
MTYSKVLDRPSLLELARAGNFQALTYWINIFLEPQGIKARVKELDTGTLKIFVKVQRQPIRKRLVRFICYRLWTLNSEAIERVQIIARFAGDSTILWKESVRISTPANAEKVSQLHPLRPLHPKGKAWVRFQILRSLLLNQLAAASFILGYWILYTETASQEAAAPKAGVAEKTALVQDQFDYAVAKKQLGRALANIEQVYAKDNRFLPVPKAFQGRVIEQIPPVGTEKRVALTFDDGPWPETTAQVLEILDQHQIRATFFWVGQYLQRYPEIAKQVVAAGHAIGNHSWSHPLDQMDAKTAAQELEKTAQLIDQVTGVKTRFFRPPGGFLDTELAAYAQAQNYAITLWSANSEDYYVSAPILIDNVLRRVEPGGIVLMHDGGGNRQATVEALPQIITTLQRQGYQFVTVPELLRQTTQEPPELLSDPDLSGSSESDVKPGLPSFRVVDNTGRSPSNRTIRAI